MKTKTTERICQEYTAQLDDNKLRNIKWVRVEEISNLFLEFMRIYRDNWNKSNPLSPNEVHKLLDELSQSIPSQPNLDNSVSEGRDTSQSGAQNVGNLCKARKCEDLGNGNVAESPDKPVGDFNEKVAEKNANVSPQDLRSKKRPAWLDGECKYCHLRIGIHTPLMILKCHEKLKKFRKVE